MQAEQPDPEGQRRVAQAISKVLRQPIKRYKTMPKQGETVTVKNMKEAIKKAQSKGAKPVDNHAHIGHAAVSNEDMLHRQPIGHSGVSQNTEEHMLRQHVISKHETSKHLKEEDNMLVLRNQEVEQLVSDGMTTEQIASCLDTLLPLYQAEGITPSSATLMAGIRQLQADAR